MKKLNLIKRLLSYSHEKQKMGGMRRYAAMLMMLLTLGVGQMWGNTTFSDGDVLFYDFSAVSGGGGVNWHSGGRTECDLNGAGTLKCVIFTSSVTMNSSWVIAKTQYASWGNINFTDRPEGKNCIKINSAGNGFEWTTRSLAAEVAAGNLIMVYAGELSDWNQPRYFFVNTDHNDLDYTRAVANANKAITLDGEAYKLGPVALPSGSYIQGHWNSNLSCSLQAGFAYVVRGSTSASNHTQKAVKNKKDYLYEVSADGTHTATRTVTTTIDASVEQGSTISVSTTAPSPSYSVVGATNTIEYYLYDGSSWSPLTVDAGVADVSSLPAGTDYKIATLLKDANGLYVRADLDEFDVYDTWAMYSGDNKIADFTTTDGVHYSITDLVINNENNANTRYKCSGNASYAQAGANSLCVAEANAWTLTFDDGQINWVDGNGTYDIHIVYDNGWKIYAEQKSVEETWYWIAGNGAHTGSEDVTKQSMELTDVSGVYSCTRTLTQNQTFHFGNTTNGYWPKTPAQSDHTNVTATSSDIQLAGGGTTYWFQFTPADQPVVMTLNTNTTPYTISFSNPVYTITYQDQGGSAYSGSNGSSLPTSHTYGTATAFVNGVKTGYRFVGWFTDASCTISAGSSIGATAITANTTYYAKWEENLYTITLTDATVASVSAGCATHPSITASTVFGATFDHWEVDGGADVASTTSSTTTVSATSAGTVTAVYTQNLYAYVEGRFHIASPSNHSSWTNSFCSGNWDDDCTNIQFDYDETNHRFFLHTYATPKELTTSISDNTPYFFIRTSTSNSSVTGGNAYHPNPDNGNKQLTATGPSNGQALQTSTGTYNVYFNNSSDDSYYVTLFFDGTKVWYEYMPAVINNVGLSVSRVPPTAPITATPNMYCKGASNKAYCWGVYTDEECTNKVNSVTFSSLGDGKVQFMAPQTQGTYYLKLTVHSTDDCNATIDDEEVVSFTVTTSQMVFFKNVPGWGNVHFYFLGDAYWSKTLGSGCAGRDGGAARGMTRIGNSDIYYYDYSNNSVMTTYLSSHSTCYIAFTDNYKPNSNNFSECQAVYRGDFSECAAMYVPENWITHYLNNAAYYNRGYWTNYMSANSGFKLYIWDKTANNADGEHQILATDVLTSSVVGGNTYTYEYNFGDDPYNKDTRPYTYGFKFEGCGGSWYGAEDDMNITKCTDWNLGTDTRKCGISVTVNQKHKFILTLAGDGHVQVSVEYPVSIGDYRLLYDDNTQTPHPSQYIRKRADGKDTVAMFIRPSAATKTLKVQRCSGVVGETITWEDYNWKNSSPNIDISGISEDGVYVFYLEQDGSGNFNNVSDIKPYSGKYYIRTNCLDGGWNSYKTSSDNLMTYAQYPEDRGYGFNYYKAKWVGSTGTDVTYTIACDYSPSLCDTLTADPGDNPLSASEAASLPHTANIRFGWHSKTNNLKREYINGSTNVSDRFLVMMGDTKLKDENGNALAISGLNANEISFTDLNNWIYRCDVTAVEGAAVKLQATYDGHEQYFIGGADKTEEIIGGSGEKPYVMRVTYDFKTNRLMTAWLPNGTAITSDVELNADMMLIREGQNAATQVYFNGSGKSISNIHTIYGVMEFKYDHMVGKFPNWNADGAYEYLMYYISFPFDVKVSEIFGCGVRGENWIIQKYNGAKRAEIGWFKGDGTTTFWETMEGDETMNAYEGYLLLLDRVTFNDPSSSLWYKQGSGNSIYLYFPSKSVASGTISEDDKIIHVPEHTCTINRTFTVDGVAGTLNHMNTDSHWNIMGTPLFETKTASTIGTPSADGAGATTLQYYYGWDKADNTLSVRSALSTSTEFLSMHAYMVQYAGDVTFHGAKLTPPPPASVAARRVPSDKNYRIELQMVNANGKSSETFVELRENACDTFALNEDMYMVRSSKMVDLYTFAGAYDVAANVLSVNNHIVPVGMDVKQAGTYRFTMPSDFSGTVTLIDTQAGARTNLALGDYEVNLEKGTLNNRFQLEINIQASTTSLEGNDVKDGGAHKFIENGAMYILRDGKVFDACGNRVK